MCSRPPYLYPEEVQRWGMSPARQGLLGAHARRIEPSTPQREWVTGPVRALVRNIQCLLNTYNVQQKNL